MITYTLWLNVQKVNELQREGLTLSKAKRQAKEWLDIQAAFHN